MPLPEFLRALFDHGHLQVPQPSRIESSGELQAARWILRDVEPSWRLEFPGAAPAINEACALWSAVLLYRAAQAAVYRDVDEATMRAGLMVECPAASEESSQHYSVDLVLRFLPELVALARRASSSDPLIDVLHLWGSRWPLSSVGMKEAKPESLHAITYHAGLLQLYVDRIAAKKDFSRLDDPGVRRAARQTLGAYAELSPELAQAIGRLSDE